MGDRTYQTLLRIFILFLIAYSIITLLQTAALLTQAQRTLAEQRERAETLRGINAALQYDIDHARDEASIERFVRERLGMVCPGERTDYDEGD